MLKVNYKGFEILITTLGGDVESRVNGNWITRSARTSDDALRAAKDFIDQNLVEKANATAR